MTDELKPCPFCGGELVITKHFKHDLYNAVHRCTAIPSVVFDLMERESIVKCWNTRTHAAGDGLREALEPFADHARNRCAASPEWDGHNSVQIVVTIRDLRRVLAALDKEQE